MVDVIGRINDTSKQIENIISEIEDICQSDKPSFHSMQLSRQRVQVMQVKGFAVVAEQIRSLSEQSAKAAVDTRQLIESAIAVSNEGNESCRARKYFYCKGYQWYEGSCRFFSKLSEIAEEQAKAMEQAETGINQISDVVQSNSANAEETSATSEELSAQAETMNRA